jgi:hypothetical protein
VLVLIDTGIFYEKLSIDLIFALSHSFTIFVPESNTHIGVFDCIPSLPTFIFYFVLSLHEHLLLIFCMAVATIWEKFNFSVAPVLQKGKSIVSVTCTHFLIFQLHGYELKVPSITFQFIVIFQCTKFWIGKDVEESNCRLF